MNALQDPEPARFHRQDFRDSAEAPLSHRGPSPPRVGKSSAPLDMIMNQDSSMQSRPRIDTSDHTLAKTSIGQLMLPVPALSAPQTKTSAMKASEGTQVLPSLRDQFGPLADGKLPPPSSFGLSAPHRSPPTELASMRFQGMTNALPTSTPISYRGEHSPPELARRFSPPRGLIDATSPPTHYSPIPSMHKPLSPGSDATTPGSAFSAGSFQRSSGESAASPNEPMQVDRMALHTLSTAPGMNAPSVVFRCKHQGCNAPPFQTQYLLNSHMNVHSNTRPHYCPKKGCPRGEGGKGFKRKNEMIRHGLVHQSPGYACPFCPEREHRYPRPDNLQRHVKVHHVDKDKDDPILREVLNQRVDGGSRGRRKRANS